MQKNSCVSIARKPSMDCRVEILVVVSICNYLYEVMTHTELASSIHSYLESLLSISNSNGTYLKLSKVEPHIYVECEEINQTF